MVGPRFEQTAELFQPRPLAAIELIKEEPIRLVEGRVAACDGGKSPLPPLSRIPPPRVRGSTAASRRRALPIARRILVPRRSGRPSDADLCPLLQEGEPWDTPESLSIWTKKARTAAPTGTFSFDLTKRGYGGKSRWPFPVYVLATACFIRSDCSLILSGIRYEKDHHHHGHGHPAGGVDGTFSE